MKKKSSHLDPLHLWNWASMWASLPSEFLLPSMCLTANRLFLNSRHDSFILLLKNFRWFPSPLICKLLSITVPFTVLPHRISPCSALFSYALQLHVDTKDSLMAPCLVQWHFIFLEHLLHFVFLNIPCLYWERKRWRMGGREKESRVRVRGDRRVGRDKWIVIVYSPCFGSLLVLYLIARTRTTKAFWSTFYGKGNEGWVKG